MIDSGLQSIYSISFRLSFQKRRLYSQNRRCKDMSIRVNRRSDQGHSLRPIAKIFTPLLVFFFPGAWRAPLTPNSAARKSHSAKTKLHTQMSLCGVAVVVPATEGPSSQFCWLLQDGKQVNPRQKGDRIYPTVLRS